MFIKNELIHSLRRVTLRKKIGKFQKFSIPNRKSCEIRDAKTMEGQENYN